MTVEELNTMPIDDLAALIERAKTTHKRRLAERRAALKREFEAKLKAEGFTLDEVLGEAARPASKPKRKTMPPKYAHPDNPKLTWSGLGRKPAWLQELLDDGGKLKNVQVAN